ncbi:MAG: hypothetical protein ACPGN3_14075 [Opitutales bacterium]
MNKHILSATIGASMILGTFSLSAQTVWSEDFDGFTVGFANDYTQGVGTYTYGFDGDGNATFDTNIASGNNVKETPSAFWLSVCG